MKLSRIEKEEMESICELRTRCNLGCRKCSVNEKCGYYKGEENKQPVDNNKFINLI